MEPLDIAEIISALDSGYWRVHHFNLIDSSQRALVTELSAGRASAGEVYLTEFQSAGRGRGNRTFESQPGQGMLLSAVVSPIGQPESRWGWIPLIVAVAACSAIVKSTGVNINLKWPNDLMIGEKKVGGIIAEKIGNHVVIGIGINCLQDESNLPADNSTSLQIHAQERINREVLVVNFLNDLEKTLSAWEGKPFPIENKYRQLCATLEEDVRVTLPDGGEVLGRAVAISGSGALVLADGREFIAADVTHLRLSK